jgi:dihydrofolate reductase
MPNVTAIAAVDRAWAIGCDNRLLFRISADLRRFKQLTMGQVLLMGRKTFDSLPGLLPGRAHVVVSATASPAGALVCPSPAAALHAAQRLAGADKNIFIIGGASVYAALLDCCDAALITRIDAHAPAADAWFPDLDALPNWRLAEQAPWEANENGLRYCFCRYERV